jgi:heptosyltransferase-3
MRLLFLKLKHIGDSLLLTPTLAAVRRDYPQAEIWVAVRAGTEGILAGCPAIDHLVTFAPAEIGRRTRLNWWHDAQKLRALRRQHFDFVFELTDGDRGRWLALFSGATRRVTSTFSLRHAKFWRPFFGPQDPFDWTLLHRVEKDFQTVHHALPLRKPIPPLQFQTQVAPPASFSLNQPYAVLHPATRWQRKRWDEDRWREVARFLAGRGLRLIFSTGPDPEEIALGQRLAQNQPHALTTARQLSWTELAAVLRQAKLFVGVDTAAMHLAAATQTPLVALLGPTEPSAWGPWQCPHRLVTPPPPVINDPLQMQRISSAAVIQACEEMLSSC